MADPGNVSTTLCRKALDKHFSNVKPIENDGCHTYSDKIKAFMVYGDYGQEIGMISYLGEGEWRIYVDNFPGQKQYFSTNLPIRSVQELVAEVARTGMVLIESKKETILGTSINS
ncbi:hypothetical protein [Marinobacterium sp. BA1]|uniref:hypothetical protein n=1 Tax=Marinobacterium sp. BA1 TaxID=3138931 RepID=UPI0032E53EF6